MSEMLKEARCYVADALEAHEHSDGRDLLNRIDAALRAEPGWQPISSAPRDGSIFLGWRALWDFPQPVCWEYPVEIDDGSHSGCVGAWVYADWLMHDADFHGIEPTHWMLLPTPPVEAPTPAHAELSPGNSSDLRGEEG